MWKVREARPRQPGPAQAKTSVMSVPDLMTPAALGTSLGLLRRKQEDTAAIASNGDRVLAIVCDGMGGMREGAWCSLTARRTAIDLWLSGCNIEEIPKKINKKVYDRLRGDGGTTIVMAEVQRDGSATIIHAGDSRAYILGECNRVTQTSDHATRYGLINFVGQHDGTSELMHVPPGWQSIVLTTDGVHDLVDVPSQMLKRSPGSPPEWMVDTLIMRAIERGGHDNATLAVILPPDRDPPQKPTLYNCEACFVWQDNEAGP